MAEDLNEELRDASMTDDIDRVMSLIARGADIHSRDDDGWTALHCACCHDRTAVASLLLERGADIHSRDNYGYTALHFECTNSQKDAAILLIESKADIYIKNNDGKTPLDIMPPEWRKELTELYNTVNRAWLARKSLLFVLIGCGHIAGVSGGGEPVKEMEQSAHEMLRDEVLRSVNMSIMSFL